MKLNWQIAPYDGMLEVLAKDNKREYQYSIFPIGNKFKFTGWAMNLEDITELRKSPYKTDGKYYCYSKEIEGFDYLLDAMIAAQEDLDKLMSKTNYDIS